MMLATKSLRIIVPIPFLVLLLGISSSADSLFDPAGATLFEDLRAAQIGDVVFIVVEERTTTSSEAKTDGTKEIEMQGGTKVTGFFEDLFGFPNVIEPLQELDIDPSEQFKATGKTTNKGIFTTRITATVIDILPNGNLVIKGKRAITVNDDTEELVIIGTIRPTDITFENTISSRMMADVELSYSGRGEIAQRQKSGLLTKLFNFLF